MLGGGEWSASDGPTAERRRSLGMHGFALQRHQEGRGGRQAERFEIFAFQVQTDSLLAERQEVNQPTVDQ